MAYFAMLSGQGWTAIAGCRQFFYARYVDWSITTPIILLELGLIAGADTSTIAAAIGADSEYHFLSQWSGTAVGSSQLCKNGNRMTVFRWDGGKAGVGNERTAAEIKPKGKWAYTPKTVQELQQLKADANDLVAEYHCLMLACKLSGKCCA
jgi:hypothetical protein